MKNTDPESRLNIQRAIIEVVRGIREEPHLGKIRLTPPEHGDRVAWLAANGAECRTPMRWLFQDVERAMRAGDDKYFSGLAKSVRAAKKKGTPAGNVEAQRLVTALCEVWHEYEMTPKDSLCDFMTVTKLRVEFEAFCKMLRKARREKQLSN